MAVPVAAIVKKVAIAILGADKETKSKIGVAIGTAIVAPFVPVMLIVGIRQNPCITLYCRTSVYRFSAVASFTVFTSHD